VLSEFDGKVRIEESKKLKQVIVTDNETGEERGASVAVTTKIIVEDGAEVEKCQKLTDGTESPADILRISGLDAVYEYIIKEIQRVYRLQAVEIADKHIEVIARQMTRKVKIESSGDTNLLVGAALIFPNLLCQTKRYSNTTQSIPKKRRRWKQNFPDAVWYHQSFAVTDSFLSARLLPGNNKGFLPRLPSRASATRCSA
jgi:hypothetical protein